MDLSFWETKLIYKVVAGSQAYGLDTSQSDLDKRGVCIPARRYLLGLKPFEQWEHRDDIGDVVIYALAKFVRLALACNPNIIELLFTGSRHVLFVNDLGQRLLDHRHLFLTKRAHDTFSGYAISQLRRIERHHRWLMNPPDHQPLAEEFGGWPIEGRYGFPDHEAQRAFRAALKHWNHYQEWLRAVRDGLLSYRELLEMVAAYEARLDQLHDISPLPAEPDFEASEALVIELHEGFLNKTQSTTLAKRPHGDQG